MLPKRTDDIFQDIRETQTTKPVEPVAIDRDPIPTEFENAEIPKAKPVKRQRRKLPRQKAGKVSCTFHLPESVRNDLQALSFMLNTPQNALVEQAITKLIKSKGIKLPKKAA